MSKREMVTTTAAYIPGEGDQRPALEKGAILTSYGYFSLQLEQGQGHASFRGVDVRGQFFAYPANIFRKLSKKEISETAISYPQLADDAFSCERCGDVRKIKTMVLALEDGTALCADCGAKDAAIVVITTTTRKNGGQEQAIVRLTPADLAQLEKERLHEDEPLAGWAKACVMMDLEVIY